MTLKSKFIAALTGDAAALAERYLGEGNKAKAAQAFARAGDFARAAQLAAECGDEPRAVEFTLRGVLGGVPEGFSDASAVQAGELLASSGHHKDALTLFELAGAFRQAADAAAKIQNHARAGRLYERAKAWRLAANYYQRAGQIPDAARALEQEASRLKTEGRAKREQGVEQKLTEVEQERAGLLARIGRSQEATDLLNATTGTSLKSARILENAGKPREAFEAFLQLKETDEALRVLDRIPDLAPAERAKLLSRAGRFADAAVEFQSRGLQREAAEAWIAAGDPVKAAERWEAAKEPLRAAEIYLQQGRPRDAARCFTAAGDSKRAAECFLRAQDPRAAAHAIQQAGLHLEAATFFLDLKEIGEAMRTLKQVPATSAQNVRATLLLVPLLVEQGQFGEANSRLQMLAPETNPGGSTAVERLYWQARAHEGLGRNAEALASYQKAVAIQKGFADAEVRLAALRSRLAPGGAPSTVLAGAARGAAGAPQPSVHAPREGPLPAGYLLAERYEIVSELGAGGMGRVYKARDRELADWVAIKTVVSGGAGASREEERLVKEVQLSRRITHPNVVRVFDIGRFDGGIFVTMELLEGENLDKHIRRLHPLPLARVRSMLTDVASGLAEAHSMNVIHRDLKPGNIFVTSQRVKVLDFGIARSLSSDTRLTVTGHIVGTPMYMSPEQLQGGEVDARSDLYALGVVAYATLAGREPFRGDNLTAIALDHLQSPPPDPRKFRPDLPEPWVALLRRMLAKTPRERHASAHELIASLANLPV